MKDIQIKNAHIFNHGGTFDIEYKGKTYKAKYNQNSEQLETNAPKEVYKKVYDYLFNYE